MLKVRASMTVEAAMVVPLVIMVVMFGIHVGLSLHHAAIAVAEAPPLVKQLDPVKEMYE